MASRELPQGALAGCRPECRVAGWEGSPAVESVACRAEGSAGCLAVGSAGCLAVGWVACRVVEWAGCLAVGWVACQGGSRGCRAAVWEA